MRHSPPPVSDGPAGRLPPPLVSARSDQPDDEDHDAHDDEQPDQPHPHGEPRASIAARTVSTHHGLLNSFRYPMTFRMSVSSMFHCGISGSSRLPLGSTPRRIASAICVSVHPGVVPLVSSCGLTSVT